MYVYQKCEVCQYEGAEKYTYIRNAVLCFAMQRKKGYFQSIILSGQRTDVIVDVCVGEWNQMIFISFHGTQVMRMSIAW